MVKIKPTINRPYLFFTVFIAGMSTLAVEFTASRMLQTVYGTSNIVWANVIGLVLLSLTIGYFLGGRLADRAPRADIFYGLVFLAGLLSIFFLLLTSVILRAAAGALAVLNINAIVGSLLLVIVALVIPVTLLGCLSPFAIRLAVRDVAEAGQTSGRIFAISTLGSLLGTYIPVLLVIPLAGSRAAAVIFGSVLLLIGLIGLWQHTRTGKGRAINMLAIFSLIPIIPLAYYFSQGTIKAYPGQIYEAESAYNYIQVIRQGDCNYLLLNEGQAYHSFYCDGGRVPYLSVWSAMMAAPFFRSVEDAEQINRVAVIGLAAGTIPKQLTEVFSAIPIDGIEIDPAIIEIGREFFAMNESNINAIAGDGRFVLSRLTGPYDVITIDAYKVPYIPWHMTTQEFFGEVSKRLTESGVVAINVGRTPDDRRLINTVSSTLRTVFPSVHAVDIPNTLNTILFATKRPTQATNLIDNLQRLPADSHPLLSDVLEMAIANGSPVDNSSPVMTDDRAPIEAISDSIVIRYLLTTGPSGLGTLGQ